LSDNKNYYYLKLKDNYFERDSVKILESMENGYIYSLIILKLYVKACKYDGKIMMTHEIPYNPEDMSILSNVLNHDIDHVKKAIETGVKLGLISIIDQKEIWMTEIQNFIGKSSTEADRIREYRLEIDNRTNVRQMYDKCTPKKEIEIEIEKELKAPKKKVAYKKVTDNKEVNVLINHLLNLKGSYLSKEKENNYVKLFEESLSPDISYRAGLLAIDKLKPSIKQYGGFFPEKWNEEYKKALAEVRYNGNLGKPSIYDKGKWIFLDIKKEDYDRQVESGQIKRGDKI